MESSAGIAEAVSTAGKDYGGVLASSGDGNSWQYEGLSGSTAYGPNSFSGTCGPSTGRATLSIPGSTFFNTAGAILPGAITGVSTSLTVGPSGIFVANQAGSTPNTGPDYATYTGVAGVAEPLAPPQASSILAGSYLGFMTEAAENGGALAAATSPVAFTASSAALAGGLFLNDDVTQALTANVIISLGPQSSTVNGLYPSASITRSDPNELCYSNHHAGVGTDANG